MMLMHYDTLFESSISYGMRKSLYAEQKKENMLKHKILLEQECKELEDESDALEDKVRVM